jgi:hypothetical protein
MAVIRQFKARGVDGLVVDIDEHGAYADASQVDHRAKFRGLSEFRTHSGTRLTPLKDGLFRTGGGDVFQRIS